MFLEAAGLLTSEDHEAIATMAKDVRDATGVTMVVLEGGVRVARIDPREPLDSATVVN